MCLTLHLDNKRFLCLFVKFVLYRGPVLCEKHRISFFNFPLPSIRLSISFSCVPCALKRFLRTSRPKMVHVVRKTGLTTHAVTTLCPHQGAYRTRIDRPIRNVVFGVMPFRAQRLLTVVWYLTAIEPSVSPDLIL